MSHIHKDILTLIDDKLDMKIRNIKIRTIYQAMDKWTDFTYREKMNYLSNEFHLSHSRIEDIIQEVG